LLRDGTESMEGIGQIISNINAIEAVVDIVKSTLGSVFCYLRSQRNGQNDNHH
jgi:hypothetical protein